MVFTVGNFLEIEGHDFYIIKLYIIDQVIFIILN